MLWSRQLEKAGRIREFLTYVCEALVCRSGSEIHEQEIGEQVFGTPARLRYRPGQHRPRDRIPGAKKFDQYFAGEGALEPVILEIPERAIHAGVPRAARSCRRLSRSGKSSRPEAVLVLESRVAAFSRSPSSDSRGAIVAERRTPLPLEDESEL